MTPETFLKEFGALAETEGGVDRLRTLVRAAAIQGQLSAQRPSDGTAEALLSDLASVRSRLIQAKEMKDLTTPKADAPPFPLPESWSYERLGNLVAKLGAGSTPLGGKRAYVPNGIAFLRSQNVWNSGLRLEGVAFISSSVHERMSGTHVSAGDVLLNITGASIGRCAVVPDDFDTGNVSQHVLIVRPLNAELRHFLQLFLSSEYAFRKIMSVQVGISRAGLSIGRLKEFTVPVPPLPEQKRIVKKVDELMALCDELEARQKQKRSTAVTLNKSALNAVVTAPTTAALKSAWTRVQDHFEVLYDCPENVQDLRQTILQLAVMGKLVKQDPNDEPAASWLSSCLNVVALEETKPRGWVSATTEDLFAVGTGSTPTKTDPTYWENGTVPWLSSAKTNDASITTPTALVTTKAVKDFRLTLHPAGSLVIALYGQGKTRGQVAKLRFDACVNQACAVLHIPNQHRSLMEWVWLCYRKKYEELRELAAGGAQPNLNVGIIKRTRLPIPPPAEMDRIVAQVARLMTYCDDLETKLNESKNGGLQLMQAAVESLVL